MRRERQTARRRDEERRQQDGDGEGEVRRVASEGPRDRRANEALQSQQERVLDRNGNGARQGDRQRWRRRTRSIEQDRTQYDDGRRPKLGFGPRWDQRFNADNNDCDERSAERGGVGTTRWAESTRTDGRRRLLPTRRAGQRRWRRRRPRWSGRQIDGYNRENGNDQFQIMVRQCAEEELQRRGGHRNGNGQSGEVGHHGPQLFTRDEGQRPGPRLYISPSAEGQHSTTILMHKS